MIDAFDGSGTVEPSPNPAQSEARAGTEDNAPSVIDRAADIIGGTMILRTSPLEIAKALYDAELLYDEARDVAICADVAFARRRARRAESRYNTLREALEALCDERHRAMPAYVLTKDLRALLSKDGNDGT